MILAGDIGGTKTTLALCDDHGAIQREATEQSGDWSSLEQIVEKFAPGSVRAACFGVAGPVVDGVAKITNLPWTIATASLTTLLGGATVELQNDLQATALGMLVIPDSSFAVLQHGERPARATIAVIAPGTGLGEATLLHDGRDYRALPSEGGHADFAPGSEEEIRLLRYLRGLYGEHVSYERVLSGHGIADLYDFCRTQADSTEPPWLTAELTTGDKNAAITKAALANHDTCAVRALAMFVDVLGAEAGNLALRGLATGGIIIGGGIPPKILPALQTGALLARLTAKGRFQTWTRALSVRVALEPRAALLGAAHRATLL
ncbi:MAG: glucokinase [Kofleriaceae bacterium]